MVLEVLNLVRGERARETLEPGDIIDVVGLSSRGCHRSMKRIGGDMIVQLDDELALNQVLAGATRDVERRRPRPLGRGREDQWH